MNDFIVNYSEHSLNKLKETKSRLGNRSKPNVIWLKENEDDSKLAYPDYNFKNGIPTMARSLNDFEEGIAVIAGKANSGKSSLLVNMMLNSLELNDDLMVLDFSFDDPLSKRYQQYIACLSGLLYQEITTKTDLTPKKEKAKLDADAMIEKFYKEDRLRTFEAIETYQLDSGDSLNVQIRRFDNLVRMIEAARQQYPNRKIVAFIDALNNIDPGKTSKESNEIAVLNDRLAQLQEKSQKNRVMVFVSAHLRKSDVRKASASSDDVKGTSDLIYNAVWLGIVRNEYREGQVKDPLMYELPSGDLVPLLTIEIHKTKVSAWDFDLYYGLISGSCQIFSLTREEYHTFNALQKSRKS